MRSTICGIFYIMPNKRSRKNGKKRFHCPYCQARLWRMGSPKHYIYYQGISEIQKNLNISRKKASFLQNKNNTYLDRSSWIEDFCCQQHGKMWLKISCKEDSPMEISLANEYDWKNTTGTINPNIPNPSVSEFSYSMSRGNKI